jgi:hypothetical protein
MQAGRKSTGKTGRELYQPIATPTRADCRRFLLALAPVRYPMLANNNNDRPATLYAANLKKRADSLADHPS